MVHTTAGPGTVPRRALKREWLRLSPHEVCHPHVRRKRNPLPQQYANQPAFPIGGVDPQTGTTLQLLAWELRDSLVVLQAQTWNVPAILFSNGQNGPLFDFGAANNAGINKPYILANINSNSGLLPSPQSFLATHVTQIIRGDIYQADLLNLAYSTYYQFKAGDQLWIYAEGPGAEFPGAEAQIYNGAVGSYAGSLNGLGYPTSHVVKSLRSGLMQNGVEDPGYNISQNKNLQFVVDPTQFSFIASTVATGSWATLATGSHGTGVQMSVCLRGALARGMSG